MHFWPGRLARWTVVQCSVSVTILPTESCLTCSAAKVFEKWHKAYKTKIELKAVA